MSSKWARVAIVAVPVVVVVGLLFAVLRPGGLGGRDALVVYCAHDARYAEAIFERFERETGIAVDVRYDTEATKSLGLTELIIRERDRPRADVFWNNQMLGTADLAQRGLLEPYQGPGYERIPARFKDPAGHYAGFAARLRVLAYNTDEASRSEAEAFDPAADGADDIFTLAKPLYGTTLTHYTVLWDAWGGDRLQQQHQAWLDAGIVVAGGNEQTARLVADGTCRFGWSDSSDVAVDQADGAPIAMVPARIGAQDGRTLCLPNTVAIVKGTDKPEAAQRLVDFLLSEQNEIELANGPGRQIPLGEVDASQLPEVVRQLKAATGDAYPLTDLIEARAACLAWLRQEYLN